MANTFQSNLSIVPNCTISYTQFIIYYGNISHYFSQMLSSIWHTEDSVTNVYMSVWPTLTSSCVAIFTVVNQALLGSGLRLSLLSALALV